MVCDHSTNAALPGFIIQPGFGCRANASDFFRARARSYIAEPCFSPANHDVFGKGGPLARHIMRRTYGSPIIF